MGEGALATIPSESSIPEFAVHLGEGFLRGRDLGPKARVNKSRPVRAGITAARNAKGEGPAQRDLVRKARAACGEPVEPPRAAQMSHTVND